MTNHSVSLKVENPDKAPRVSVHYEWGGYALWLSGRYGFDNIGGHEIGLSPGLVRDLLAWVTNEDTFFDPEDPPNSQASEHYFENGFVLALRVRRELPDEWIVTGIEPTSRTEVEIPRSVAEMYPLE